MTPSPSATTISWLRLVAIALGTLILASCRALPERTQQASLAGPPRAEFVRDPQVVVAGHVAVSPACGPAGCGPAGCGPAGCPPRAVMPCAPRMKVGFVAVSYTHLTLPTKA